MNKNFKAVILKALAGDGRLWDDEKEFNQTRLLDLAEKLDEKIIGLLFSAAELKAEFFVKIKNVYVFKINEFRFFMEENKIDNSYTAYKNRIGLTDGKKFLKDTHDVVLDFPYKDCVLEGGQSTEEGKDNYYEIKDGNCEQKQAKRKEIFFNSVLARDEIDRLLDPKALTNWKRYTKKGAQQVGEIKRGEDGVINENLIIKGNNLLALHSLKSQFSGKVKLIYIDPPYNTGSDSFAYNDKFNHSTWLTFMKNRLEAAKELLREDGIIFVQCDEKEQAYLKVLMDSVFERENFEANITWRRRHNQPNDKSKMVAVVAEYILAYAKNSGALKSKGTFYTLPLSSKRRGDYTNPDNDPRGDWDSTPWKSATNQGGSKYEIITPTGKKLFAEWLGTKETFKALCEDKRIFFPNNGNGFPRKKIFLNGSNGQPAHNFWMHEEFGSNQEGSAELDNLFKKGTFANPKPEKLMERIITLTTKPGDVVLDFCLGSATTAAVAHKMGRQYVGVEQMDCLESIAVERLKKVIAGEQGGVSEFVGWKSGGEFIYFELAKWNEIAKGKIRTRKNFEELKGFFKEMCEKYFLNYNVKIKEFNERILDEDGFKNLGLEKQKEIFAAMLDNNQMYVNKTEMADKKFGIGEGDQKLTKEFYEGE